MSVWGPSLPADRIKQDFEKLLLDLDDPDFLGRLETRELSDAEIMGDERDLSDTTAEVL